MLCMQDLLYTLSGADTYGNNILSTSPLRAAERAGWLLDDLRPLFVLTVDLSH